MDRSSRRPDRNRDGPTGVEAASQPPPTKDSSAEDSQASLVFKRNQAASFQSLGARQAHQLSKRGAIPGGWTRNEAASLKKAQPGWKQTEVEFKIHQRQQIAQQKLSGLMQPVTNLDDTSMFELSIIDELEPPEQPDPEE